MKKNAIILVILLCIFSCVKQTEKHKISKYVTIDPETSEEIFWYLIADTDSGSVSYATSSRPITNFANVTWTNSSTKPTQLANEEPEETVEADVDTESVDAESTDTDSSDSSSGDTSSDSSSDSGGDSGGGDGGGDGGGGE